MQGLRGRGCIFKKAVLSLLICIIFRAQGVLELACPPGIIEVGTSAGLICSTSAGNVTFMYTGPNGITVQCDMKTGSTFCATSQGYTTSVLNDTHTQMEVKTVKPAHGGNWTCKEGGGDAADYCFVFVKQTPSCTITSDRDTKALGLSEEVSLTVAIVGFYCSSESNFILQTGGIREALNISTHVNGIKNESVDTKLNITESHFGEVRLIFGCHNEEINLACGGVESFNRGKLPALPLVLGIVVSIVIVIIISIVICVLKRNWKTPSQFLEHYHPADDVNEEGSTVFSGDGSVALRVSGDALWRAERNVGEGEGVYSLAK